MNILENEMVRKYFWCNIENHDYIYPETGGRICACRKTMAMRILQSMQQPIKKGEQYLNILAFDPAEWYVYDQQSYDIDESLHLYCLRLPDRFQKQECECTDLRKSTCGCWVGIYPCRTHFCIHAPKPSPEKCGCQYKSAFSCSGNLNARCLCHCHGINKDAVEEKLSQLLQSVQIGYTDVGGFKVWKFAGTMVDEKGFENELRALISLARQ